MPTAWILKLKTKWNIQSDKDFWMIMLTFSLAGMTIFPIRRLIFPLVGINHSTPLWIMIPSYILICFPSYQIGLLLFGTVLGQFKFFWEWEKKTIRLLTGRKNIKH